MENVPIRWHITLRICNNGILLFPILIGHNPLLDGTTVEEKCLFNNALTRHYGSRIIP